MDPSYDESDKGNCSLDVFAFPMTFVLERSHPIQKQAGKDSKVSIP